MVYRASHSPEAKHMVYSTWEPRVVAHQVEAGGILPRGAYALLSWVELRVFNRNPFMTTGWALLGSGWKILTRFLEI